MSSLSQSGPDPSLLPTVDPVTGVICPPKNSDTFIVPLPPILEEEEPSVKQTSDQSDKSNLPVNNQKLFRAHRDTIYDKLTEKQVNDYGFYFDSDVYVYNSDLTQLTSSVLNRNLFLTSDMFKTYTNSILQEASAKKLDEWLRLWGKIPAFLEVRTVPGKGFGIFTKQKISKGCFLGYYDGIRHPFPILNSRNNYLFTFADRDSKPVGSIDAENLTYSNWASLINDGDPSTYNISFVSHPFQILVVTSKNVEMGEELVGSYGTNYWVERKKI